MRIIAVLIAVQVVSCNGDQFTANGVVPDIMSHSPQNILQVSYYMGVQASLGNVLTPSQTWYLPTVSWPAESGALYTLILADPDAPSRWDHSASEWLHWKVVNIPGAEVARGVSVADYAGPSPPSGTGLHRYTFSVWKQNRALSPNEYGQYIPSSSDAGRSNFRTMSFATLATGQSDPVPVAANFFQAQS